ncbi:uncharacterized protein TNCV_4760331 [Trichonephila clavipes]|uniref:Mutator-like transposase domain-containing protein n=1 Tax=Trichonephila clavipes TaxID=2585209 RepID=A0A8X6RIF5_TRICX|nr:uncharacterized protein TNCV_4760331 [Trichonephila clavipes]
MNCSASELRTEQMSIRSYSQCDGQHFFAFRIHLGLFLGYISTTEKIPRHRIRASYEQMSVFQRGDGDSKTFLSITEKEPYGDSVPIEKIECVGHVQKQMGSRLRKLKALWGKKKLSHGKTIGGKGRLTDAIISKLTTFYGNAIRANSHNVNEMRQAV